ncbi:MAG TPA: HDOD domain-containing protein [Azonexus sp.]|nr:HDOD domain-containing protein [Azonexus sp.]
MHPYQWQWGINQWVEYLRDKDTPVLPRTRAILEALQAGGEEQREGLSARDLANIVYADPYLALKLLRRAEERRSRQLGHDTTTPLAAVLQTGYDELQGIVANSPILADILPGCHTCEFRSVLASSIARSWARRRADVSPDEVSMAALLVETGELLLWHFAPEMTDKETQVRDWNERYWALALRTSEMDFTLRQLTMALAQAWALPSLIVMLIKGTDTPRANIPRLAADVAKLITNDPEPPALLAILREARKVVPGASLAELSEPLPLPDEIRARLLTAIESEPAA